MLHSSLRISCLITDYRCSLHMNLFTNIHCCYQNLFRVHYLAKRSLYFAQYQQTKYVFVLYNRKPGI